MRNSLTVFLVILIARACSADVVYTPYLNPQPIVPDTIKAGEPFMIDIYMDNQTEFIFQGATLAFCFYDPTGGIQNIEHWNLIDSGGICALDPGPHKDSLGDYSIVFNPLYFELLMEWLNYFYGYSWDGQLPDTIRHGFLTENILRDFAPYECFEPAFSFGFIIEEEGEFCIDSIIHPDYLGDWYIDVASARFDGPWCWVVDSLNRYISGFISVKNERTGIYEEVPDFYFDIITINGNDTTVLTQVATESDGVFVTEIPYTTSSLYLRLQSIQPSNSKLRSIYRPNLNPISLVYDPEIDGTEDNIIFLDIDSLFPYDNLHFNDCMRVMRDILITETEIFQYNSNFELDDSLTIYAADTGIVSWHCFNNPPNYYPWIYINWDSSIYKQEVCHEIGHQIFFQLQGRPASLFNNFPHHALCQVTDSIFAFDEGFAEFIRAISSIPELIWDRDTWEHIESNMWWTGNDGNNKIGDNVSGSVTSMLYDLFDSEYAPTYKIDMGKDDDDVRDPYMMLPIIFDCIELYASFPDSSETRSIGVFFQRLLGDSARLWYDDPDFMAINTQICDIFKEHKLQLLTTKDDELCGTANEVPNEQNESVILPSVFSLSQNYPNPFNCATKISFNAPKDGDYKLEITNILGQMVWDEKYESLKSGEHQIVIDNYITQNLSSGVYFYRVISDVNIVTRKMMLLK